MYLFMLCLFVALRDLFFMVAFLSYFSICVWCVSGDFLCVYVYAVFVVLRFCLRVLLFFLILLMFFGACGVTSCVYMCIPVLLFCELFFVVVAYF